jgi:hypothetical protein
MTSELSTDMCMHVSPMSYTTRRKSPKSINGTRLKYPSITVSRDNDIPSILNLHKLVDSLCAIIQRILGNHNKIDGSTYANLFKIICTGQDRYYMTVKYSYRVKIYSNESHTKYIVEFDRRHGNVVSFLSRFYDPCVKGIVDAGFTVHK